ncbi:MAG: hypothetical protein U0936_05835 [Planctomycetaceae bacterium]
MVKTCNGCHNALNTTVAERQQAMLRKGNVPTLLPNAAENPADGFVSMSIQTGLCSCPGQFERCLFAGDKLHGEINQLPVTERLLQKGGYGGQSVLGLRLIEIETTTQNDGQIRMQIPDAFGEFIAADPASSYQ